MRGLLEEMRRASALVDEADDPTGYQTRLVALALIARQYLRDLPPPGAPPAPSPPAEVLAKLEALTSVLEHRRHPNGGTNIECLRAHMAGNRKAKTLVPRDVLEALVAAYEALALLRGSTGQN